MTPGGKADGAALASPPQGRPVLRQRWAELLFLHWPVPAEVLSPLLPPALSLDTFEGQAYVGLVPFTMTGVRPVWAPPIPGLSHVQEVNVRTYVHVGGQEPGVWFFSLDASNPLAVALARTFWRLPYHLARMSLTRDAAGTVRYLSRRRGSKPAGCDLRYAPCGLPRPALAGSREHFLVERYVLYAQARGRLYRGRVKHAPYPLQPARVEGLEESLLAAARLPRPAQAPLAHYAREVSVEVFPLRPVPPEGAGEGGLTPRPAPNSL